MGPRRVPMQSASPEARLAGVGLLDDVRCNENQATFAWDDGTVTVADAEGVFSGQSPERSIAVHQGFSYSSANAEDAGQTEKLYEKLMVSMGNHPQMALP